MTKPFLKWAGGKTRLLPQLLDAAPRQYRRYYEPFVGGGALFFALQPAEAVLGDDNSDLIETYRAVRSDLDAVVDRLRVHASEHARSSYYYEVRDRWNLRLTTRVDADAAAMMVYMNKTCFNGLWRVNSRGEFNVPRGDYENPTILDESGLRDASAALARADVQYLSFEDTTSDAAAGDFVYFDPPYDKVSASSFTAYASPFGTAEQRALAACARALVSRGVHVVLSNSDTPLVRELYAGFELKSVTCSRSINSVGTGRGKVSELIITGR